MPRRSSGAPTRVEHDQRGAAWRRRVVVGHSRACRTMRMCTRLPRRGARGPARPRAVVDRSRERRAPPRGGAGLTGVGLVVVDIYQFRRLARSAYNQIRLLHAIRQHCALVAYSIVHIQQRSFASLDRRAFHVARRELVATGRLRRGGRGGRIAARAVTCLPQRRTAGPSLGTRRDRAQHTEVTARGHRPVTLDRLPARTACSGHRTAGAFSRTPASNHTA